MRAGSMDRCLIETVPFSERRYMKVNTQFTGNFYGEYKPTSKITQKGTYTMKPAMKDENSASDMFQMLKETMMEEHKLTIENIKNKNDWREMSKDQWDKVIENVDKYIDDCKEKQEKLEELRKEAVMKAAAYAPANMKAEATSKAALFATTNGIAGVGVPDQETSVLEKLSWTYNLETEDQTILATAKMANEFAPYILSKAQELALTAEATVGNSEVENLTRTKESP